MMRFKVDENLPPDVAEALRANGHDAMTVAEQGMIGKIDALIADVCKEEGRAIVTLDLDFANVRDFPPEEFAGLIVIRTSQPSRVRIMMMLRQVLSALESTEVAGTLWIVEESRIRIRDARPNDDLS